MKAWRFTRPRGPICYELSVFGHPVTGWTGVDIMLASPLTWHWESAIRERPAEDAVRRLHRLHEGTASRLRDDLDYRDEDEFGYFVAAYGLRGGRPRELDVRSFKELLRGFAAATGGPLEIVIVQLGDCPNEYVFVASDPTPEAQGVLEGLGIAAQRWRDVPYGRLRLAALESVYGL